MKLLALGGSGNMGQTAVRTILDIGGIDQLIVADYDVDRTNKFVESLNDKRVQARAIDVTDTKALEGPMQEVDVVMNTVGPYYRYGIPIVQATIKTRRHYADISDDYRPTQEILEMDDAAERTRILKENSIHEIEMVWEIPLPTPGTHVFWQPWLKGYHGERGTGPDPGFGTEGIYRFVWIDQDLKYELTGSRD